MRSGMMADDAVRETGSLLTRALLRLAPGPGAHPLGLNGLTVTRHDRAAETGSCFFAPAVSLLVQGRKRTVIGADTITYGPNDCLVNHVDLPGKSLILEAAPERPFLAMTLLIDRDLAARMLAESPAAPAGAGHAYGGVSMAPVDPGVADAFLRLAELAETPDQLRVLGPLVVREIHYRILMGPQGGGLRQICLQGSHSSQVAQAIAWLREHFVQPVHVDDLADRANMARTTFHRHFKRITSLSPLQYQKRLRLHEAQRLMLAENMDATSACLAVGYESPTQFNREYRRLFGEPPHRNVSRLRRS